MISLTSFNYLVAESYMPCDAMQVWMDLKLKIPELEKGISTWYEARKGINIGDTYLEYKFDVVDEDSGEVTEMVMSCRVDMNKLMVKNQFYPKMIQQAFKKYKS